MTPQQVKQQIKSTALNKIIKIYDPLYKFPYEYGHYVEESHAEQRECSIEHIIREMNRELEKLDASTTTSS